VSELLIRLQSNGATGVTIVTDPGAMAAWGSNHLSMDALNAFPQVICQHAQIYCWPLDKRERNTSGRPGKLHAKVAVVDDRAVFSSANLTDDEMTHSRATLNSAH